MGQTEEIEWHSLKDGADPPSRSAFCLAQHEGVVSKLCWNKQGNECWEYPDGDSNTGEVTAWAPLPDGPDTDPAIVDLPESLPGEGWEETRKAKHAWERNDDSLRASVLWNARQFEAIIYLSFDSHPATVKDDSGRIVGAAKHDDPREALHAARRDALDTLDRLRDELEALGGGVQDDGESEPEMVCKHCRTRVVQRHDGWKHYFESVCCPETAYRPLTKDDVCLVDEHDG